MYSVKGTRRCDPFDATNALKLLIDQSEERILLNWSIKKCFEFVESNRPYPKAHGLHSKHLIKSNINLW